MSLPPCPTCPPGRCDHMVSRPDGGLACSHLLSLGIDPAGRSHDLAPEPDVEPSMPAGRMAVVIALIEQRRCPCRRCNGSLGAHDRPSWLICVDCGCAWQVHERQGRRYADTVRKPSCKYSHTADAALSAWRRTA